MGKIYVAYGSNLSEEQMAYRCPSAKIIGMGLVRDWRLMFKGDLPNSYATIEEWTGYVVPVLVWELTEDDERRLDRYEGYPISYIKRGVEVELQDGKKITGMVYTRPEDMCLNPPCDHYYAVLYAGYEAFGFDLAILEDALIFSDRLTRMFSIGQGISDKFTDAAFAESDTVKI